MRAFPSVALIISVKSLSVVVFPAPFGPRKPTHFAPSIFKFKLESATNEPYLLERLIASRDGFVKQNHDSPARVPNIICNEGKNMHITISDAIG